MRRHQTVRRLAPFLLLALQLCARQASDTRRALDTGTIQGTWRAVRFVTHAGDSTRTYPFGDPPRGYLVYDATGHVFFQVVRPDGESQANPGRWYRGDSSALNVVLREAAAYFGTYTADPSRGVVVHKIEGEIPPNIGVTEVATPYRLHGDSLVLGSDSASHWAFIRVPWR